MDENKKLNPQEAAPLTDEELEGAAGGSFDEMFEGLERVYWCLNHCNTGLFYEGTPCPQCGEPCLGYGAGIVPERQKKKRDARIYK